MTDEIEVLEVLEDEVVHWAALPITEEFRKRLIKTFDHQDALLAMQDGASSDLLKGRAQVLAYIKDPMGLFIE